MEGREGGRSAVLLVGAMMLLVAWSIEIADYAPGLAILTPTVVCAVLAGALLATRWWLPATLAHGWSLVLCLASAATLATVVLEHHAPEGVLGLGFVERMAMARDWYLAWLSAVTSGARMGAPLIEFAFVVTMAMLVWLLAYICTWFVVRYASWWGAVLPSGFALLFNLRQSPDEHGLAVALFLMCALVLAQQTHLAIQLDLWRQQHIAFGPGTGPDYLRNALLIAVVVVAAAWLAPERANAGPWQALLARWASQPSRLERQMRRILPQASLPVDRAGGSFGPRLPLGGSVALGRQVIFEAQVEGAESAPRYWRMAVFDRYDGSTWHRTPGREASADDAAAGARLLLPATIPVTQSVRVFQGSTRQLYAVPQPAMFDLSVRLEVDASPGPLDILTADSLDTLGVGDEYRVVSHVSVADLAALRSGATADPTWVARYLELPDGVPPRVRDLAARLTSGAANRFDAAAAIEAHLRTYEYSEVIAQPPDRDRVDWFLFEERRGYCDYYSSAFVVLARAAGIPARLAAGYSTGEYVEETGTFRQYESDAHTWPEVYLPPHGWIEYEPTAGDARIDRPAPPEPDRRTPGAPSVPTPVPLDGQVPVDGGPTRDRLDASARPPRPDRRGLAVGLSILGLLAGAMATAYVFWQRPLRGLTVAQGFYARLVRLGTWLRLPPRRSDTPHEYAQRLAQTVPRGAVEIGAIVDAYVRERFGRKGVPDPAGELAWSWSRLRRVMLVEIGRWRSRP